MIKRLFGCYLVLALLCGWTSMGKDPHNLQPFVDAMEFDGVNTKVAWVECGEVNGYYQAETRTVFMCKELETLPDGVIQFVLVHELAHGIIDQLHIPFTGSEEVAADELAGVVDHLIGHDDATLAAAKFFAQMSRDENPFDDHPGDIRRAYNLLRLTEPGSVYFRRALRSWAALLAEGK